MSATPAAWRPEDDLSEILIQPDALNRRVAELGQEISQDYAGKRLLLIGVLKGAAMFLVDLARQIHLPLELDFMATSSYGASTQSSGIVRILKDLEEPVDGKDILIVEDIVDRPREADVSVDYVGFEIPDRFVVGYGLDYAEAYRNLPYIGILKPERYRDSEGPTAP
jgi:hypoxanthine phosphoribosyltransferase